MKKLVIVTLICCRAVMAMSAVSHLYENTYAPGVEVKAFYPASGVYGIHFPKEKVQMVLAVKSTAPQPAKLDIELALKDFFDKTDYKTLTRSIDLTPGKMAIEAFEFPAPERFGHFVASATLLLDSRKTLTTQSAFSVLDEMTKRDPFFALDNGYLQPSLLDGYARIGVGTLELVTQMWYAEKHTDVAAVFKRPDFAKMLASDFNLIFDFVPCAFALCRNGVAPDVTARIKAGKLPMTDADIAEAEKYGEAVAGATKGRITYYQISEEYDVSVLRPKQFGGISSVLAEYVQLARAFYRGIKKGNPEAKVAVLGSMGIDYFRRNPPFPLSRIILDDLGSEWDMLTVHAYSNGRVGEDRKIKSSATMGLRDFLTASSQLAVSYGRPPQIINGERGAASCYFDAFDSSNMRSVAYDTAQSLIITRSTPCIYYCAHFGVNPALARRAQNPAMHQAMLNATDYSLIWKSVLDEHGKNAFVPKPGGVAYAVAARQLAFVKPSREVRYGYIYCYTFSKADNTSLAALWSDGQPSKLTLDLPEGSTATNMMGNSETLNTGKHEFNLDDAPLYLALPQPVIKTDALIAAAKPVNTVSVAGAGRRLDLYYASVFIQNFDRDPITGCLSVPGAKPTDKFTLKPMVQRHVHVPLPRRYKGQIDATFTADDGRTFKIPINCAYLTLPRPASKPVLDGSGTWCSKLKAGELKVPDNVYPRSALMQEYNLFKNDGHDIHADYYLASDEQYFYLGVKVYDQTHYQPESSGKNALNYDSLQFAFSRSQLPPHHLRPAAVDLFRRGDYHFGMVLTKTGPSLFHLSSGPDRESGIRNYPHNISRKDNCTFYEAAIPWEAFKQRYVRGGGFRFSLAIVNKDKASDNINYSLSLTSGMTFLQDSAEFMTMVNAE
ncbi:MAG: hypothetical protein PHV59_08175 [Victivallales bacterium]|nr:hypothetical protein [Victivallales bacterium]